MTIDIAWLESVMLIAVRVTAFLVIAPPFSTSAIPGQVKAMLGIGLALAMASRFGEAEALSTAGFIGGLLMELVTGALLGFLCMAVFSAVQSAGGLIDLFGGFQSAQMFDPTTNVNGAQFSRLFQMLLVAVLFASGGYQVVIAGLARSFDAIPLGGRIDADVTLEALAGSGAQLLLSALQIAGPLLVVLVLADLALGLLTRVAPSLNALTLGFPLKIMITLVLAALLMATMPNIVTAITGDAVDIMGGLTSSGGER